MRRVAVVGPAGSGKSTLARRLGAATGLPVTHLDWVYWRPGWARPDPSEFEELHRGLVNSDHWIIDGNMIRVLGVRAARAEMTVVLDVPVWTCLWRVLWRRERPDQPAEMSGRPSVRRFGVMLAMTALWPVVWRRRVLRVVRSHSGTQPIRLRSRREVDAFVDTARAPTGPMPLLTGGDMSALKGELITETFEYDGGRQVTVYVPPGPVEGVVFAGDGQSVARYAGALESSEVPSTMIVGVHGLADETGRLNEYSPGFEPERFAAHERFFVEDVRRWVQSRFGVALPAERTAVFGASAGGELALAIGLRHPDIYGAIFCASPGGGYKPPGVPGPYTPTTTWPSSIPRTYLVGGKQEQWFLDHAITWADALRDAGADVVIMERVGEHGGAFWHEEFPLMVAWAFRR